MYSSHLTEENAVLTYTRTAQHPVFTRQSDINTKDNRDEIAAR